MFCFNARYVRNKTFEVHSAISPTKFDPAMIRESWLNNADDIFIIDQCVSVMYFFVSGSRILSKSGRLLIFKSRIRSLQLCVLIVILILKELCALSTCSTSTQLFLFATGQLVGFKITL